MKKEKMIMVLGSGHSTCDVLKRKQQRYQIARDVRLSQYDIAQSFYAEFCMFS
jgi:hypothetical protein